MNQLKYVFETKYDDRIIDQKLFSVIDEHVKVLQESIIDTREKQIRKALVDMGWTPPSKKRKAKKL